MATVEVPAVMQHRMSFWVVLTLMGLFEALSLASKCSCDDKVLVFSGLLFFFGGRCWLIGVRLFLGLLFITE